MVFVVVAFAVVMLVLAVRANSSRALLLVKSPFTLKPLVACLVCFALSVVVSWALVATKQVEYFAVFIVAFAVGVVSMLIVVATKVMRLTSLGSLTLVDEKTLRVQLDGREAFTVDSVRVAKTNTSSFVRYEVTDELHLVGSIEPFTWESLGGEALPMNGTLISGSSQKLFDWAQRC